MRPQTVGSDQKNKTKTTGKMRKKENPEGKTVESISVCTVTQYFSFTMSYTGISLDAVNTGGGAEVKSDAEHLDVR